MLIIITAVAILFAVGCHFSQQQVPTDATSLCSNTIDAAEFNSWFETGAVSLNGAVNPANSVTFPNVPNCSFYKWSQQMFLWLTSPSPSRYGGSGLVMNSPLFYDVSPPDAMGNRTFIPHTNGLFKTFAVRAAQKGMLNLPVILEKKTLRLLEILPPVLSQSGRQLALNASGEEVEIANAEVNDKNKEIRLLDNAGKPIDRPRAILSSKSDTSSDLQRRIRGFGESLDKSSLIQRFTFKDKIFFLDLAGNVIEVEQGQADGGVLVAQNGSLVYYATTVNEVFAYLRTQQGATFPFPSTVRFPITQPELDNICSFARAHGKKAVIDSQALAIEIKTAWVEAAGLPDSNKFITITGKVPTYDKSNPNHWVPIAGGERTVKLALVGMHVVGSTAGHSELVWGSFEHASTDPAAEYKYNSTGSPSLKTVSLNTTGNWVFCASGAAAPFNETHAQMGAGGSIDGVGGAIGPSNVVKTDPWGLTGTNAGGNSEIININNSARSLLDPADIRKNYIQIGTTWTINGTPPVGTNVVGSNKLANSTMETFQQGSMNCFDCHSTNKTDVSHTFRSVAPLTF
jgi:hypothetical protein